MNSHADTERTEVDIDTAVEMWYRKFSVFKNGNHIPFEEAPNTNYRGEYDKYLKMLDEYFHDTSDNKFEVSPSELQQHRELDSLITYCDELNDLLAHDESNSGIAEYYNIESYVKALNDDLSDQIDDEVFTEFDWSSTTNEWQNFERSILEEKTDYLKAWLNDLKDETALNSEEISERIEHTLELLKAYEEKYFSKSAERGQEQELSDPLKRAMQLINEYCEAEFEGEADFSDLSKVDLAYTTDAETEAPIQVYADLENFRLVKEYDGKIASEEKFDSLDDLSDKVLSNLEFDDLVAFDFAVPAEQQIGQEQKSPENTDILKALGIEDSRIAFTDVTLDNEASFVTGTAVDESNIENEEQFLDYAVENIGKTIEVRADRYVLGGADVEARNATPEQANYIQANRSEVMKQASHMQESHMQDSKVFAVAVSEADREKLMARKAEILETSARNQDKFISSIENSGRLLPFLNANRDFHSARLKTLNQKNATRTDKIERNEVKIERLTARVEKLQAANEMLGSIFGTKAAPIRALIDRNNARIEKIQTKKIPKRENKINKQLGKIERGNRKIEREQCKVDKLENLSKAIGSFGILNGQERRQQFAQAMDGLRDASMRSVQFKIEKCSDRIAALSEKYQSASASDRLNIAEKLKNQIEKKNGLVHKGDVLYAHERAFKPFEQQTQAVIDGVMDTAKNECAKYEQALESGADSTSLDTFAENISVSACEKAINIESERVEAAVKASIKPNTFLDETEKPAAEKNNAEKAKKTDKAARGKRPDIIGSVKYSEIEDKVYLKMSAAEAQEKAELLKGSGVRYSGRIYEDGKATLTVEKADVPKLREITERKPSVLGEIGKIKAEQKDAPKKEKPAKNLQEEI